MGRGHVHAPALARRAARRVVQRVSPSVVQIESDDGLGSGVVYDDDGHIVTNDHVLGDGRAFTVTLADGGRQGRDRAGDVIVSVAGTEITSSDDLSVRLAELQPGQTVPVKIVCPDDTQKTAQVKLGETPDS